MCPAFCLTDYEVEGSTLIAATIELKDGPPPGDKIVTGSITRLICSYPDFGLSKDFISCRTSIWETSNSDMSLNS